MKPEIAKADIAAAATTKLCLFSFFSSNLALFIKSITFIGLRTLLRSLFDVK